MLSSGLRIPLLPLLLLLTLMKLSWSFTDEDKKLIVDLHNHYRSKVIPPAANMLKLSWDPELETFAKDYAAKCIWEHNKERGWRGENLFAMYGDLNVTTAVEQWYDEYKYYNMTTLTCKEGEMCGHYTQVVWATTGRVGCGTQFCKTLQFLNDTDMHLLVCNYVPPGNVKGYKPYKEGAPCSMCPDGYSCKKSLCVESSADAQTTASTTDDAEIDTASPDPTRLESASDLTASPTPQPTKAPSATRLPETIQTSTEEPPQDSAAKGPTSSLAPTSNLDLNTSPNLPVEALVTTASLLMTSGGLSSHKAPTDSLEQPPTTVIPPPLTTKPRSRPKTPSAVQPIPRPPATSRHPFYRNFTLPKKPSISRKIPSHRLSAYAKAIKGTNNAVQSSAGKAASMSVCLPCLGCKRISHADEIKAALKELTFRYPYAPCFSPLPRWQRHSKCSSCGHTWGNALRKARPYWLNSL